MGTPNWLVTFAGKTAPVTALVTAHHCIAEAIAQSHKAIGPSGPAAVEN
jgi:hypothetical protein